MCILGHRLCLLSYKSFAWCLTASAFSKSLVLLPDNVKSSRVSQDLEIYSNSLKFKLLF